MLQLPFAQKIMVRLPWGKQRWFAPAETALIN
jgi:hypothetical protein